MIKLDLYEQLNRELNINKNIMQKFYHSSINYLNIKDTNIFDIEDSKNSRPDCYDIEYDFKILSKLLKNCITNLNIINSKSIVIIIAIKNDEIVKDGLYYTDFIEEKLIRYQKHCNFSPETPEKNFSIYYIINISMYQENNTSLSFLKDLLSIGGMKNIIKNIVDQENSSVKELEFNAFSEAKNIGVNVNYMYLISADKIYR